MNIQEKFKNDLNQLPYPYVIINDELYIFNLYLLFKIRIHHLNDCIMQVIKYNNITSEDVCDLDRTDSIYNSSGNNLMLFQPREWRGLYAFIMDVVGLLKIIDEEKIQL
jgi:hypothetical protein